MDVVGIFPMTSVGSVSGSRVVSIWTEHYAQPQSAAWPSSDLSTSSSSRRTTFPDESQLASFPGARLVFKTERNPARDFESMVRALIKGLHDQLGSWGRQSPAPKQSSTRESGEDVNEARAGQPACKACNAA